MEEQASLPAPVVIGNSDNAPLKSTVENLSKILALVVVALYVCGFLIVSLNDFRYGFADFSPLRPRILTAGAWFGIALAAPLTLANQFTKHKIWTSTEKWWVKAATLLSAYWGSCLIVLWAANAAFIFDQTTVAVPKGSTWEVVGLVVCGLLALVVFAIVLVRLPLIWRELFPVALLAFLFLTGYKTLFWDGKFDSSALIFWMFTIGGIGIFELKFRSWKSRVADWQLSFIPLLVLLLFFSRTYYPHIKASWGGGSPIPVTITLTKDSAFSPSKRVGCILIDETDEGLYVVGNSDRFASYIPKTSVGLIYFADVSASSSLR